MVKEIKSKEEFDAELANVGDKLVRSSFLHRKIYPEMQRC